MEEVPSQHSRQLQQVQKELSDSKRPSRSASIELENPLLVDQQDRATASAAITAQKDLTSLLPKVVPSTHLPPKATPEPLAVSSEKSLVSLPQVPVSAPLAQSSLAPPAPPPSIPYSTSAIAPHLLSNTNSGVPLQMQASTVPQPQQTVLLPQYLLGCSPPGTGLTYLTGVGDGNQYMGGAGGQINMVDPAVLSVMHGVTFSGAQSQSVEICDNKTIASHAMLVSQAQPQLAQQQLLAQQSQPPQQQLHQVEQLVQQQLPSHQQSFAAAAGSIPFYYNSQGGYHLPYSKSVCDRVRPLAYFQYTRAFVS